MRILSWPLGCGPVRGAVALAALVLAAPAFAQDASENRAWQFKTPQEIAARAAIADMIARQRAGVYAAPVYNATIARQYNCSVGATATGNQSAQSAIANSPTVTGAAAASTGNADTTEVASDGRPGVTTDQRNSGPIGSTAIGATNVPVNGSAWQAQNSSQANSGAQSASVQGSTACGFGTVN